MKDSFASLCFAGIFFVVLALGITGLSFGGRISFIPSKAVHALAVYWIPLFLAFGWIGMLAFHRDARDPLKRRKLVEFYSTRGAAWTVGFIFISALFFYAVAWLCGDAGIQKSAVFLSGVLPAEVATIDVHIYGIRDFSASTTSIKWVKIDINGHVDDFSYPTSQLTFLPCANDTIRISGDSSWAGLRVNRVECSPQTQ